MTLEQVMKSVEAEMDRAATIHGPTFNSLAEAWEAIEEEYQEVWEALNAEAYEHANVEIIQLIGVLVKLMRMEKSG